MNTGFGRMASRKLSNLSEAAPCKASDYSQSAVSENDDVTNEGTSKLTRSCSSRRFPMFKPKERLRRQLSVPIRRTTSQLPTNDVTADSSSMSASKSTQTMLSTQRGPRHRWGSLRHSLTTVRNKITNKRCSDKKDPDNHLVEVEIVSAAGSGNRKKPTRFVLPADKPYLDYSSSLMMTSLENGRFTAELPLRDVPTGDLTLRVEADQVLLIITDRDSSSSSSASKGEHVSYVCGYLHLPIYVDPCSLQLGEEKEDRIQIICLMKGFTTASTRRGALSRSNTSPGFKLFKSSKPKLRKHPSSIDFSSRTNE